MNEAQAHIYEFGDFRLDASKHLLLKRDGEPVPLTPKVFETLLYLLQHRGTGLAKEELMKAIWPDTIVEENNLSHNISVLRRVFGEVRAGHRYIVTVPGWGYRFVAEVRTTEKSASVSLVAPMRAIAVLPFRPLVAEARDAALELGMAETLITRLSSRAIVVRPISSVRKYMDLDQDPLAAGRELRVEFVLDGSIQRCGDQIRVTARLVNVTSGAAIWSGTFDEKFTSIFAVQDVISEKVAGALALGLTTVEKMRLTKRYTENTEAYRAYLNGLYYWYKYPAPGYEKSRDYFQHAIDVDPTYALGHLGLSLYYGFASAIGILPPNENWPRSEAAANNALALDETLADTYNPQAAVKLYYYRDWSAAERSFRRGIELNPNSPEIRHHYAMCLVLFGRNEEAITEMQRASELDPLALRNNLDRGKIFFFIREYDQAIDQFRKTLELEAPFAAAHEFLGYAYEQKGMHKEAVAQWSKALTSIGAGEQASSLERTYAASGFEMAVRALARQRLEKLNDKRNRGAYVPAIEYVTAYTRLADKEQAFVWLHKAVRERNRLALELKVNPIYDKLRDDPRFAATVKCMRLA